MSKLFSAVDGDITGRDPGPGRGLSDETRLVDALLAPGVTHLHDEVAR